MNRLIRSFKKLIEFNNCYVDYDKKLNVFYDVELTSDQISKNKEELNNEIRSHG